MMLPGMCRSVVQVMPTGLFKAMYTVSLRRAAIGLPSTSTTSPSSTCVPSSAGAPLTRTRPAAIHASASRREQIPVSLMYLLSRTRAGNSAEAEVDFRAGGRDDQADHAGGHHQLHVERLAFGVVAGQLQLAERTARVD